jgi:hypothetical protein
LEIVHLIRNDKKSVRLPVWKESQVCRIFSEKLAVASQQSKKKKKLKAAIEKVHVILERLCDQDAQRAADADSSSEDDEYEEDNTLMDIPPATVDPPPAASTTMVSAGAAADSHQPTEGQEEQEECNFPGNQDEDDDEDDDDGNVSYKNGIPPFCSTEAEAPVQCHTLISGKEHPGLCRIPLQYGKGTKAVAARRKCFICRKYLDMEGRIVHQVTPYQCIKCGMPLCILDRSNGPLGRQMNCLAEHLDSSDLHLSCKKNKHFLHKRFPKEMQVDLYAANKKG